MEFQLHLQRWPGNSISCEICCGRLRKYAKSPHGFISMGCSRHWQTFSILPVLGTPSNEESERKTRNLSEFATGVMQKSYIKKKKALSFKPPSLYLNILSSTFSISRDLQGLKGSKKAAFFKNSIFWAEERNNQGLRWTAQQTTKWPKIVPKQGQHRESLPHLWECNMFPKLFT